MQPSFSVAPFIVILSWLVPLVSADEATDQFERHIRPVLVEHCYRCHSQDAPELRAGLRLDTMAGRAAGGDSGPAVVAGNPDASLLLKAIRYDDDVSPMPPDQKLPDTVVARFTEWIAAGAPAPPDTRSPDGSPAQPSAPADAARSPDQSQQGHWAFARPRRAEVPKSYHRGSGGTSTTANSVDRILARHHHERSIPVSPLADRATLLRRLSFDLVGLPPTYEAMQAFVRDPSPDAVARRVDHLLASPRFGERWARYWLDVARFADTKGYVFTEDRNYPDAYKYRDWVIDSFNRDRPYGEFVRMQLAADHESDGTAEDLAAMGFLTLGRRFLNNRHDIIDDRIDVTTRGLMGLTVTCARCHDHKYDPIPAADYYSLYGVFASSDEPGGEPSPLRLVDRDEAVKPVIFLRGQPDRRGPEVPRQFLEVVEGSDRQPFVDGSGRREMAEAIASPDNPLTARVFVNRVWGHLFGSYLVETPSDFGTRCPEPVLVELLDDLAVRFVENGESLKWLIRELVLSEAYQRSSDASPQQQMVDPANEFFARANRRRLDFEAMRDSLLTVSGQLDAGHVGGPSAEITGDTPSYRRAVYAHIDRQNFPGLFRVFDVALPDTHNPKRFQTTVPQQALYLMNSPFAQQAARELAARASSPAQPAEFVIELYCRVLSRMPDDWEQAKAVAFLQSAESAADPSQLDAPAQLAQILLLSNEFLFLD